MTGPRTHPYAGSARIFHWYGLSESDTFACRCGWSGTFMDMAREIYDELVDGSCQQCDTMLVIRSHPTMPEIQADAAARNPGAVDQLRSIEHYRSQEQSPSP